MGYWIITKSVKIYENTLELNSLTHCRFHGFKKGEYLTNGSMNNWYIAIDMECIIHYHEQYVSGS